MMYGWLYYFVLQSYQWTLTFLIKGGTKISKVLEFVYVMKMLVSFKFQYIYPYIRTHVYTPIHLYTYIGRFTGRIQIEYQKCNFRRGKSKGIFTLFSPYECNKLLILLFKFRLYCIVNFQTETSVFLV